MELISTSKNAFTWSALESLRRASSGKGHRVMAVSYTHLDKAHKYFTCKNCKTICRVPVGKGKIVITCPKCGAQIHART